MGANNFIDNLHPLATYAGLMASLLNVSLEVHASKVYEKYNVNTIQSTCPMEGIASIDTYNYTSTHNIFSLTSNDVSSILAKFTSSILKDSTPLNQEIEEYINDVFWDLV